MTTPVTPAAPFRPAAASAAASKKKKRPWLISRAIDLAFAAGAMLVAGFGGSFFLPSLGNPVFWTGLGVIVGVLLALAAIWLAVNEKLIKSRVIRGLIIVVLLAADGLFAVFGLAQGLFFQLDWRAVLLGAAAVGALFAVAALFWWRTRLSR